MLRPIRPTFIHSLRQNIYRAVPQNAIEGARDESPREHGVHEVLVGNLLKGKTTNESKTKVRPKQTRVKRKQSNVRSKKKQQTKANNSKTQSKHERNE
jgi:hypothetical protein